LSGTLVTTVFTRLGSGGVLGRRRRRRFKGFIRIRGPGRASITRAGRCGRTGRSKKVIARRAGSANALCAIRHRLHTCAEEQSMPLADSSYPALSVFWTIVEVFLWVLWFWILIMVIIDIFRSHDLSGWGKALWFLFVLFIPLIGVLAYLIVRGSKMQE